MRLICKCGSEMTFEVDDNFRKDGEFVMVKTDAERFSIWAERDMATIVCHGCGNAVQHSAENFII